MVLVHGALDRSASFLRVARALGDRPVVVFDRRGYGRSELSGSDGPPMFEDHVADLLRIVRWTSGTTGRTPLLVGHSLGGALALVAASRLPASIAGLLTFEAPLLWESWWPRPPSSEAEVDAGASGALAEQFMRRIVGDDAWESLPERTRERRRAEGSVLDAELRSARRIEPPDLGGLAMPVIVAAGTGIDSSRRRAVETLLADVPTAVARFLPGAPHNAHSAQPDAFAALVEELDSRVGGANHPVI